MELLIKRNNLRIIALTLFVSLSLLPVGLVAQTTQRVWCLRTDKGQLIEMSRVKMLAAADGQSTFEVIVRDGQGATGVESISFEQHESAYVPEAISDDPPLVNETGPWCIITDSGDSIAMSRVTTLANADGRRQFEIVTNDGDNKVGINTVYFGRGKTATSGNFKPITVSDKPEKLANPNNPWCLITSNNDTIAMSRISVLSNADSEGKFDIITSDGEIRTNVSYVRFIHGDTETAGRFKEISGGGSQEILANPNNPWCLITEDRDTVAMSRVQMIANADNSNRFEIVTNDGVNITDVSYIRFAHGDTKTAGGFKPVSSDDPTPTETGEGPWCLITDRGDSIAVGRISMLANIDANALFEVVTKYGEGTIGVRTVRFARGLSPLSGGFDPTYIDLAKKGDANDDGTIDTDDIIAVQNYIFRGPSGNFDFGGADANSDGVVNVADIVIIINTIEVAKDAAPLLTPVRQQLTLSACGPAQMAIVRDVENNEVGQFPVVNGATTLYVEHLTPGAYLVEIGTKTIVFIKK